MIALLKYNAGNSLSLQNALSRLGYQSIITDDIATLKKADKVIFPGVGQASTAMSYLREKKARSGNLQPHPTFLRDLPWLTAHV